jgi:hypothetical protein
MTNEDKQKQTKKFFRLFRKQETLFNTVLQNRTNDKDRQTVALCLSEIYFRSQHLIGLIKKISETNLNYTESDLDSLLGNLVYTQIDIYDELTSWIKQLKKPLKTAIDNVEDLGVELYGWQ